MLLLPSSEAGGSQADLLPSLAQPTAWCSLLRALLRLPPHHRNGSQITGQYGCYQHSISKGCTEHKKTGIRQQGLCVLKKREIRPAKQLQDECCCSADEQRW